MKSEKIIREALEYLEKHKDGILRYSDTEGAIATLKWILDEETKLIE
jgi:hypothetical protein